MSLLCKPTVTDLPVYEVASTGIEEWQAKKLAESLEIPVERVLLRDGIASFVDPVKYLAIPTISVVEPEIVAGHLEATKNRAPEIPIEVRAIDYEALSRLSPLCPEEALKTTLAALECAKLTPAHATPVIGHTLFKTVSKVAHEGVPTSKKTNLDTHVSYRFTLDGYLLVGPGAQVQVSYGPEGNVTRLFYSTRTLKKGPSVKIISADVVRSRFAGCMPDDAEIKIRLIYWAPPLRHGICSSPLWSPSTIIPWYAVTISRQVANPSTRELQTRTSRVHLIPATNDCRYIPSVALTAAAPQRSLVEAHASVTGGTPPYTYLWAGSNPDASSSTSNSVSYVPLVRDVSNILRTISFDRTDSVSVTVVDANGVLAQAGQAVQVTARAAPETRSVVSYGCESPNDPGPSPADGSYAPERIAWLQAMGAPGQGGGSQRFCWLADNAWPGDFIEPLPPGTLEPNAWITGDADYSNWGINTTNIALYNGDGGPYEITQMYPGATPADYNSPGGAILRSPGSNGDVQIGSQAYDVDYRGSWGNPNPNDQLQWLAMYACQVLEDDSSNPNPWDRWGPAFNGLHSLLGFETTASDNGVGFMTDFPGNILGATSSPQTVVQGWLNAAISNQMGTPAAMGPIQNVEIFGRYWGISNFEDYYWGKGSSGPNISQSAIDGWWYIQGTDAEQEFP